MGIVREIFNPFSLETFAQEYFEKKPLVIRRRSRSPDQYGRMLKFGIDDVDSVIENGVAHAEEGSHMVLGSDWNIIKRVFVQADGEFWTAALPPSENGGPDPADRETGGGGGRRVSLTEVHAAFQRGGFSVVINRLQRRWRGVAEVALALEDVLGHPVNANLYMTPPSCQGFEAHFDWMDGIVVQLTGSKRWILYDEMVTAPRADLKYKPTAADLGEPIAELELNPGDLMYIPRGWPHEAAVNGTTGASGGARRGSNGPSLHVTFGVESALSGTYESLVHHALEVASAEHPYLFGPREAELGLSGDSGDSDTEGAESEPAGEASSMVVPWLELLHVWVHDVASRDERLRRAVPLAPLFFEIHADYDFDRKEAPRNCMRSGRTDEVPPNVVVEEFQAVLEACVPREGSEDASSTLRLLDSLLPWEGLQRVRGMFEDVDKAEQSSVSRLSQERRVGKWSSQAFTAFDRDLFSSAMRTRFKGFQEAVSVESALKRMIYFATNRAKKRAATTDQDLERCGQSAEGDNNRVDA